MPEEQKTEEQLGREFAKMVKKASDNHAEGIFSSQSKSDFIEGQMSAFMEVFGIVLETE